MSQNSYPNGSGYGSNSARDYRGHRSNGGQGYSNQDGRHPQQQYYQHHQQRQHHPYRGNWSNESNGYRNQNRPNPNKRYFQIESNHNASFFIHPYSMYNDQLPAISPPKEVGILLSDKRRLNLEEKERVDRSNAGEQPSEQDTKNKHHGLKYLVLPPVTTNLSYDLRLGVNEFVPHIPHQKGIDLILEWIVDNVQLMMNKSESITADSDAKVLRPDFVCWRGLVTALACAPYERSKDMMFSIILFKGTYYFCEIETERQKQERLNINDQNKAFTYWGHKFESYITADAANQVPNGVEDVPDPEDNYAAAIETQMEKFKLFYCAEIDCCMNEDHKELSDYCEIKTARGEGVKDLNIERNMKYMKWWIQSFLAGIEKIVIGLRNDDGIVHSITDIQTKDLLNKNPRWSHQICFNFLNTFLKFVKMFCKKEKTVYLAERALNSDHIKITELDPETDSFKANFFLRDWFIEAIEKLPTSA